MLHHDTLPVCVLALRVPDIVTAVVLHSVTVYLAKGRREECGSHLL
jgi:hypothetical protein